MGGMAREKGGQPTTLSTLVIFTVILVERFSYFYIHMNYVDEIIDIHNANKEEILHELNNVPSVLRKIELQ